MAQLSEHCPAQLQDLMTKILNIQDEAVKDYLIKREEGAPKQEIIQHDRRTGYDPEKDDISKQCKIINQLTTFLKDDAERQAYFLPRLIPARDVEAFVEPITCITLHHANGFVRYETQRCLRSMIALEPPTKKGIFSCIKASPKSHDADSAYAIKDLVGFLGGTEEDIDSFDEPIRRKGPPEERTHACPSSPQKPRAERIRPGNHLKN